MSRAELATARPRRGSDCGARGSGAGAGSAGSSGGNGNGSGSGSGCGSGEMAGMEVLSSQELRSLLRVRGVSEGDLQKCADRKVSVVQTCMRAEKRTCTLVHVCLCFHLRVDLRLCRGPHD